MTIQTMKEQFEERMRQQDQRYDAIQTMLKDEAQKREIAGRLAEAELKHQHELENIDAKHQSDVAHTVIKNVVEASLPNGSNQGPSKT